MLAVTTLALALAACGPSAGESAGPNGADLPQRVSGASGAVRANPGATPYPTGFVLMVVEDRGGQVRVSSGQIGEIARLSPMERRAVQASWQSASTASRKGVYCARLVDPQGRAAAHRCITPSTAAHLAPRNAASMPADAPLAVVAFALRLPWPATATGGGWQVAVDAPGGRSAAWRPRP